MNQRPTLNTEISEKDFLDFYWLKEELIEFCKSEGLRRSGGKIEITERIAEYLRTGNKGHTKTPRLNVPKSSFDWHKEQLSTETVITNSYRNTQNVRKFYTQTIGMQFKFNVKFMSWMKSNTGKTLGDSIEAWHKINQDIKNQKTKKEIAPQFEYNTYIRDFLADNPNLKRSTGIELWKIKKSMRGPNRYDKSDLKWLSKN